MNLLSKFTALAVGLYSISSFADEAPAPSAQKDILATRITANYPRLEGGARDSFPTFNRTMWWFNYDIMDHYALRPVAHGYVYIIPQPFRRGVSNFISNISEPNNTVNNLLLGRVTDSSVSVARFALNSTVGMLGLFDIATDMGLKQKEMSFSTVLGKAKVTQGPYFMVPVVGPMTLRSGIGTVVDNAYWPYSAVSTPVTLAYFAVKGIDARAKLIDQESMIDNAFDPYITTRDFYLQYEQAKVNDGVKAQPAQPSASDQEVDKYLNEIDYQ